MSLIIKGMDMPYCCVVCPFKEMYNDGLLCKATKPHQYIPKFLHKRNEKCPLTELSTPHGRLIDADAHIKLLKENHCGERCRRNHNCFSCGIDMYIRIVENEPTVIKAEGGNE